MEINIHGNKLKITDSMKKYVEEKIPRLTKYFENSDKLKCKVVVKVERNKQIVEITIPLESYIVRAEEAQEDFYAAVDKSIDKLERQIRKNKTKLISRQNKGLRDFKIEAVEDYYEKKKDVIEKRKTIELKPMSEEEAILQMELLSHQFYLYKDCDALTPTVVYKRKNGGYGIIESE